MSLRAPEFFDPLRSTRAQFEWALEFELLAINLGILTGSKPSLASPDELDRQRLLMRRANQCLDEILGHTGAVDV